MTVSISTFGGADLEKALHALGDPKFMRRAAMAALRKAALPIRDKAKAFAPKDQLDLERAIAVKAGRRERGNPDFYTYLVGINVAVDPPRVVARASGRGTYRDPGVAGNAVIQEFGSAKMAANPFLTPAMDSEAGATPGRIVASLGPEIERQAAKMAKAKA